MDSKKPALIIVESPSKAKKIATYVGTNVKVLPSVGHIRDLPTFRLGVDVKNNFAPAYEVPKDKTKVVADLRKAAAKCDVVYLASDPDREGESIAWHLREVLQGLKNKPTFYRVRYNEVTKPAVLAALAHPTEIDQHLVDAQQARRIEDRLSGFKISSLISNRVRGAKSAGRVQSVALRMIVDRERAVRNFIPTPYWLLGAVLEKGTETFDVRLASVDGKAPKFNAYGKEVSGCNDEGVARGWLADLQGRHVTVENIEGKLIARRPPPPFITSTLQQAASTVLHFSPDQTMRIAQGLYEEGYITYMRTDGFTISETIRDAVKEEIAKRYGAECVPARPNVFGNKVKNAQEAHEPIRPTDVTKDRILGLDGQAAALYQLIWQRFVASQMAPAQFRRTTTTFVPTEPPALQHAYRFTASSQEVVFKGYLNVWSRVEQEDEELHALPTLSVGEVVTCREWTCEGKETQPPPRFNEASLVKALEENGIGRPSTYAATIRTLLTRAYVESGKGRVLTPTQTGEEATQYLLDEMPEFIDIAFTAKMEDALDEVAAGNQDWVAKVGAFYERLMHWIAADKAHARALVEQLLQVKTWGEPVRSKTGRVTWDPQKFVTDMQASLDADEPVLKSQMAIMTRLAIEHRAELPNLGAVIELPPEADHTETQELLAKIEARAEKLTPWETKFFGSIQSQVARSRPLSEKQLALLRKIANPEAQEALPQNTAASQALLGALGQVTAWAEPTKRGKKTFDDREFIESFTKNLKMRGALSEKQFEVLKKLVYNYREQIVDFAQLAETYDIKAPVRRPRKTSVRKSTSKKV